MSTNLLINYSIATHKGTREINEDASWVGSNKNKQWLIIVCDGIGSQDDSQIASLITVEVFKERFSKRTKIFNIDRFFKKCLKIAHRKITRISNKQLNNKKIGTTLVLSFINGNKVTTFNLGDSRLYHYSFDTNTWTMITRDHNLYNYFSDLAEKDKTVNINELCVRHRSQLFALTKCLESGSDVHHEYDKFVFKIASGDVLFQATDGVYYFLKLADVSNAIEKNSNNFEGIAKNLIQLALANKSNDNLTCVVVEAIDGNSNKQN